MPGVVVDSFKKLLYAVSKRPTSTSLTGPLLRRIGVPVSEKRFLCPFSAVHPHAVGYVCMGAEVRPNVLIHVLFVFLSRLILGSWSYVYDKHLVEKKIQDHDILEARNQLLLSTET